MIMECPEVRKLAEPFVSEELLAETTQAVVAHLDRCAACFGEVQGLRRLRAATRAAFLSSADLLARPEFAGELRARLVTPIGWRASIYGWRRWAAAAAILVVIAGAGFGLRRWSAFGLNALLQAAAGDHQFCALTYKLTEPPITLEEAGRRYDAINAALARVEPAPGPLSGGAARVLERHSCVYGGRRFAHIVVGYKGRAVSILVAEKGTRGRLGRLIGPGPSSGGEPADLPETNGFRAAGFVVASRMILVVSSLDQADVTEIARAMMAPIARAAAGA